MNIKELQTWLNDKGAYPKLVVDGMPGPRTENAILQVFTNKNAIAITEDQLISLARELGDTNTKRIKAVASVESGGSGWFNSGHPKILYERHYFYRLTKKAVKWLTFGWIGNSTAGGYTTDINNDGINDSWNKLVKAAMINPDAAFQSVSIGKFQVMGSHYKMMGYTHPINMLYAAVNTEYSHYAMLVNYIKGNGMEKAFLALSTNPQACRLFARGYNGKNYEKYNYHIKLANAMK